MWYVILIVWGDDFCFRYNVIFVNVFIVFMDFDLEFVCEVIYDNV